MIVHQYNTQNHEYHAPVVELSWVHGSVMYSTQLSIHSCTQLKYSLESGEVLLSSVARSVQGGIDGGCREMCREL